MNILLWIVQGVLALLYLAGGAYKAVKPEDLAQTIPAMSLMGWRAFGALEVAGAVLLVLPAILGRGQALTPMIAGVLAVETLVLAALYARQSYVVSVENPLVWALVMALAAGFLVVARYGQVARA
jgi:hypothetical protein